MAFFHSSRKQNTDRPKGGISNLVAESGVNPVITSAHFYDYFTMYLALLYIANQNITKENRIIIVSQMQHCKRDENRRRNEDSAGYNFLQRGLKVQRAEIKLDTQLSLILMSRKQKISDKIIPLCRLTIE